MEDQRDKMLDTGAIAVASLEILNLLIGLLIGKGIISVAEIEDLLKNGSERHKDDLIQEDINRVFAIILKGIKAGEEEMR